MTRAQQLCTCCISLFVRATAALMSGSDYVKACLRCDNATKDVNGLTRAALRGGEKRPPLENFRNISQTSCFSATKLSVPLEASIWHILTTEEISGQVRSRSYDVISEGTHDYFDLIWPTRDVTGHWNRSTRGVLKPDGRELSNGIWITSIGWLVPEI